MPDTTAHHRENREITVITIIIIINYYCYLDTGPRAKDKKNNSTKLHVFFILLKSKFLFKILFCVMKGFHYAFALNSIKQYFSL